METYIANVSTGSGISPAIITAILAFISSMISVCPKPPTPAALIQGGGVFGRFALARAVREVAGIRPLSPEGQKLIEVMQSEASKVSEGDATLFLSISQPS